MLRTAPPAGGLSVLQAQRLGIARFLLDAVHATERVARRRKVELRCTWESRIGQVQVDELKMHHLLCILLLRAVERASPLGVVLVSAALLGDRVRICICEAAIDVTVDEASFISGEADPSAPGFPPWPVLEDTLVSHGGRLWIDGAPGERAVCCFTLLGTVRATA